MSVSFLFPLAPFVKFPTVRRVEPVSDDPLPVDVGHLVERNARARNEWWYRLATGSHPRDLRTQEQISLNVRIEFKRYQARRWLRRMQQEREQSHLRAASLSNVTFFPPYPRKR